MCYLKLIFYKFSCFNFVICLFLKKKKYWAVKLLMFDEKHDISQCLSVQSKTGYWSLPQSDWRTFRIWKKKKKKNYTCEYAFSFAVSLDLPGCFVTVLDLLIAFYMHGSQIWPFRNAPHPTPQPINPLSSSTDRHKMRKIKSMVARMEKSRVTVFWTPCH